MRRALGTTLFIGLFLFAGLATECRAQQRGYVPGSPSNYPAGPVGGVQRFNPNWRSNGLPPSAYGTGYPVYNHNYGSGYGYGGGYGFTTWPVPYAVSGATGNAYVQLPYYNSTYVSNATGFGMTTYGSYSGQYGGFGVPFNRGFGTFGSSTGFNSGVVFGP